MSPPVPRETFATVDDIIQKHRDQLENYLDQLLWWNKRVNLVSRNVSRETIWQHIRHSLLITQLPEFKEVINVVDAGTGGGLPGMPIAITHPHIKLLLNDIVSKKCIAVKQIIHKMELNNTSVSDGSIEKVSSEEPFLLISKHAFKINELYNLASSLPWQQMILYKGIDFENELEGINDALKIDVYDLSSDSKFYEDKAILVITRS